MNSFYEVNYQQYFDSTINIDPASFLSPLADSLNPGSSILDIGCGSGRDLLWLKEHGFHVTGFEQASRLAALAREHTGCPVIVGDYLQYDFATLNFDAIVMVGALVHQPRLAVLDILKGICRCLQPGGYLLITMKEGHGVFARPDGREFTLWQQDEIEAVYSSCGLDVIDFSRQLSKLRPDDIWLGHVLRVADGR